MITVSLAICAFFGARAEETEYVYFTGEGGIHNWTAAEMRRNIKKNPEITSYQSPFTNALSWSDRLLPHYGPTYVAEPTNGITVLQTPFDNVDHSGFKTLVLRGGIKLFVFQQGGLIASFNDLRVYESAEIQSSDNEGSTSLGGMITVDEDAKLTFRCFQSRNFFVDSEIRGSGLLIFNAEATTSSCGAPHFLRGMNTNFYGKIQVRSPSKRTDNLHTILSITNEFALGGVLNNFTYDAVNLTRLGELSYRGTSNLVLSKLTNRGVSIGVQDGLISVNAESGVLTLNCPITLGGATLQKRGAGRLVLGSALRFTSVAEATSDNPEDSKEVPVSPGSHCFDVREGSLSMTHCDALNGAKIAFSNNTEMVMSIDITDGDMKRYGMKCDKIDEPFATDMPIKLVESEKGCLSESKYSVAIATVKAEYAETAKAKLSVMLEDVNNYRLVGMRYVANEKENEEDPVTVTFYADILHNGLVISVR
ncbi:MAG: hypothetical protein E7046_12010 [Lentisphaerae bacterium]|nr:hypothetical protein [Lentisphaerota bacterium]